MNDELQHRNAELGRTNNDLVNFLASTHQGVVFVGRDLRIRWYTPIAAFYRAFGGEPERTKATRFTDLDVTELRHAEGLRRQRVAELAAADKSKNEFLAMLAHELRPVPGLGWPIPLP